MGGVIPPALIRSWRIAFTYEFESTSPSGGEALAEKECLHPFSMADESSVGAPGASVRASLPQSRSCSLKRSSARHRYRSSPREGGEATLAMRVPGLLARL